MSDRYDYEFHLARARAECVAADRAASAITRAIHIKLAALHDERASSLAAEGISFEVIPGRRGQGMFFRAEPAGQEAKIVVAA